ncbi:MAG TPA: hypothetical protein VGL83_01710 [Stellaceae bacterium]
MLKTDDAVTFIGDPAHEEAVRKSIAKYMKLPAAAVAAQAMPDNFQTGIAALLGRGRVRAGPHRRRSRPTKLDLSLSAISARA